MLSVWGAEADALFNLSGENIGRFWARGFALGVWLSEADWEPMFKDKRAAEIVMAVSALDSDDPEAFEERITPKVRSEIVEDLPTILQIIAAYWRSPDRRLSRLEPIRSTKVGRNEPCPCGSGKKFKKMLRQWVVTDPALMTATASVAELVNHVISRRRNTHLLSGSSINDVIGNDLSALAHKLAANIGLTGNRQQLGLSFTGIM